MSGSIYKLKCPNCGESIRIRNSVAMHPLLRTTYMQCVNVVCGATYRGQVEITHLMSPSGMPNPTVNLPLAPASIRREAQRKEGERQLDIEDMLAEDANA